MKGKVNIKSRGRRIDLSSYSGKWVAFIDNHPVASEKNLNLLMKKIKKKHLSKEPSIMLVPHKDEGPYILQSR